MSGDFIKTFKNFLKIFESKGLSHIQGEDMSITTKQLCAPMVSLDDIGALPDETYGDILQGFAKRSNENFKAVNQHLPIQKGIDHLSLHSHCHLIPWNSPLSLSSIFSIMMMIFTTILQPSTYGLCIVMSVHASTVFSSYIRKPLSCLDPAHDSTPTY